jgi:hypothetical protein
VAGLEYHGICWFYYGKQPALLQWKGNKLTQERTIYNRVVASTILFCTNSKSTTCCAFLFIYALRVIWLFYVGIAVEKKEKICRHSEKLTQSLLRKNKKPFIFNQMKQNYSHFWFYPSHSLPLLSGSLLRLAR